LEEGVGGVAAHFDGVDPVFDVAGGVVEAEVGPAGDVSGVTMSSMA
jgi:hypothetical protein